jgi:hypothetical protein
MKNRISRFETNQVTNNRSTEARMIDPQLITELMSAITACQASPLVPSCIEEFVTAGDVAQGLRSDIESLKHELPTFILKGSPERITELVARLKTCTEYAQKVAKLKPTLESAAALLSGFDEQVLLLNGCVHEIDAKILSGTP